MDDSKKEPKVPPDEIELLFTDEFCNKILEDCARRKAAGDNTWEEICGDLASKNLYRFKPELLLLAGDPPERDRNWNLTNEAFELLNKIPRRGKRLTFCEAFRMYNTILNGLESEEYFSFLKTPIPVWAYEQGYYVELDPAELAEDFFSGGDW